MCEPWAETVKGARVGLLGAAVDRVVGGGHAGLRVGRRRGVTAWLGRAPARVVVGLQAGGGGRPAGVVSIEVRKDDAVARRRPTGCPPAQTMPRNAWVVPDVCAAQVVPPLVVCRMLPPPPTVQPLLASLKVTP